MRPSLFAGLLLAGLATLPAASAFAAPAVPARHALAAPAGGIETAREAREAPRREDRRNDRRNDRRRTEASPDSLEAGVMLVREGGSRNRGRRGP